MHQLAHIEQQQQQRKPLYQRCHSPRHFSVCKKEVKKQSVKLNKKIKVNFLCGAQLKVFYVSRKMCSWRKEEKIKQNARYNMQRATLAALLNSNEAEGLELTGFFIVCVRAREEWAFDLNELRCDGVVGGGGDNTETGWMVGRTMCSVWATTLLLRI